MFNGENMEININNEKTKNKQLVVKINEWTGIVKIFYDGKQAKRVKWRTYEIEINSSKELITFVGNQYQGFYIKIFDNKIEVLRKLAWYEILLSTLILTSGFVFAVLAGVYTKQLGLACLIGALCGGVGGLLYSLSCIFLRKYKKIYINIIILIELLLISISFNYILLFLIFKV